MSAYTDKALDALRAMGINPDITQRVVIDMRNDGMVLVHRTAALREMGSAALGDLLGAVAEMPISVLSDEDDEAEVQRRFEMVRPLVQREFDEQMARFDVEAAAERAWRQFSEPAPGRRWADLSDEARENFRAVARAVLDVTP